MTTGAPSTQDKKTLYDERQAQYRVLDNENFRARETLAEIHEGERNAMADAFDAKVAALDAAYDAGLALLDQLAATPCKRYP